MENKCWFCEKNEAENNLVYEVHMRMHNDRKNRAVVDIPLCRECADKHKKGDRLSQLMYLGVVALTAVAIFALKIDYLYVAIAYFILLRPLSNLSIIIRNKITEPDKSVCAVSNHPDVVAKQEEGYIETRRF